MYISELYYNVGVNPLIKMILYICRLPSKTVSSKLYIFAGSIDVMKHDHEQIQNVKVEFDNNWSCADNYFGYSH